MYMYIYTLGHTHKYAYDLFPMWGFSGDNDARCRSLRIAFLYGKRRRFDDVSPLFFSNLDHEVSILLDRYGRRGGSNGNNMYKVFTEASRRRKRRRGRRRIAKRARDRASERAGASRPSGSRQRELEAWKPYNWDG